MLQEYMWQSEADWPLRKGMVNEIRNFFSERNSRLVSERTFPDFVKKLELVLYENAKSQEEYIDRTTLLERLKVEGKRLSPTKSPERNVPTDTSNLSGRTEIAVSDESSLDATRTVAPTNAEQQRGGPVVLNGLSNIQENVLSVPSRRSQTRPGKRRSDSIVVNPSGKSRCKLSPTLVGENQQQLWQVPTGRGFGDGCDILDQRKETLNRSFDFSFPDGLLLPNIKAEGESLGVGVEEQQVESFGSTKRDESNSQSSEKVTNVPEVPKCQPWECLDSSFEAGPLAGILSDEVFPEPDFSSGDLSWLHEDFLADKSFPCAWDEVQELEEHIAASNVSQEINPNAGILPPSPFGNFGNCGEGLIPTNGPMMDMPFTQPQAYQGIASNPMSQIIPSGSRPTCPPSVHMGLTGLGANESVGSLPSLTGGLIPTMDIPRQPVCRPSMPRGSDLLMPNLISPHMSSPAPFLTRKESYAPRAMATNVTADNTLFPDTFSKEIDPLAHAYECRRYPCTTMCEQLKKLFDHVRLCRNRGGNCSSCRWLGLLMSVHAPNCKGKPCRLPCCT